MGPRLRRDATAPIYVLTREVITTGDIGRVATGGESVDVVTNFVFLRTMVTKYGVSDKEIRRIIVMGKAGMRALATIWKYGERDSVETKVKLVNCLI